MNLYNVLLNNKIPFVLLESSKAENVIYCKSFSDYLFNVGTFVTKSKEVILEYVTEDNEKYVIADVTFENGECFRNVRFKVVVNENVETPHSTINLNLLTDKTKVELPKQQKQIIEESDEVINEPAPVYTASPLIETPDYTETVNEALVLQEKLKIERQELKKQKILLEKQEIVKRKLAEYKQELLEEYFNATKKQSEALNEKLDTSIEVLEKDLLERITNSFNEYSVQLEASNSLSQKEKFDILLDRLNTEINKRQEEINTFTSDKILLESDENRRLLAEKSKELEKVYGDKLVVELQRYKEELFNDFTELSKVRVDEILSEKGPELFEKIKGIEDKVKKLIEEKTKFAEKGKFTEEQQKYIADTAQYWARRLLDLGSGGGSVAVQYANGGVMNGNLSVNNLYPNNNIGEIGTPTNRWDKIYANQIDSLNANIVVELSGFFVDGDFTVNGVISAQGGNSNQWNSVYSNVNTNSAKYILDGGNTTGAGIMIGTTDNFNLELKTFNTRRLLISSTGGLSGFNSQVAFNQGLATGTNSFAANASEATATRTFAIGNNCIASNTNSSARGSNTRAYGLASSTEGSSTSASNTNAHAEGTNTLASGQNSHAEGSGCVAGPNNHAHAEGLNTTASGIASHAEGEKTLASNSQAHAEGQETTASGPYSHAEGYLTIASGQRSHAEGYNTQAQNFHSHSEGRDTIASGSQCHAEGLRSVAGPGGNAHAEGRDCVASGDGSHAEGNNTRAIGINAHSEGSDTIAAGNYSHVAGRYAATALNNTWVWHGNSTATEYVSATQTNQFLVSAAGGVFFPGNVGIGTDNNTNALTIKGKNKIISTVNPLSSVTFTGEAVTATTSVTALDAYIKVELNGGTKYIRLYDII